MGAEQVVNTLVTVATWVIPTSLVGLVTLYLTFISLLPKLSVESVVDRSKRFASESRLKIKNLGRLPAWNIRHDVQKLNLQFGNMVITNGEISIIDDLPGHLSAGESTQTKILGQIYRGGPIPINHMDCTLVLRYEARFLLFRKQLSRQWRVELRHLDDGFAWDIFLA